MSPIGSNDPCGSTAAECDVNRAEEAFAESFLTDRFEIHPACEQRVDDLGVPLDPSPLPQDLVDLVGSQPSPVGSVAGHGVERVGDREDPGLERDLFAGEMIGVTRAVVTFVVVSDARKDVMELPEVVQDRDADLDVRLDPAVFLGAQGAGFLSTSSSMPILPMSWSRPDR